VVSRGCTATLTLHTPGTPTRDAEGVFTRVYTDTATQGFVGSMRSDDTTFGSEAHAMDVVVMHVGHDTVVTLDMEITTEDTIPLGMYDGRYRVNDIRTNRLHQRVYAKRVSQE